MLKFLKSKAVKLLAISVLLATTLGLFNGTTISVTSPLSRNTIDLRVGYIRIAMASGNMDFPLTQVGIQAALNSLPVTGGRINLISTSGTVTFAGTVSRAIPNVTWVGTGNVPLLQNNGVTPLISTSGQTGWVFRDFSTDAGGITRSADTILDNVHLGATYYALASTGTANFSAVTDSGLTSGRITMAGASGLLSDDADLTFSGATTTMTTANITTLNAPTGRVATELIASANATTLEKSQADVVCDGTADDVQINAAITANPATQPNIVQLTEGYYYVNASTIAGTGTSDYSGLTIRGAGSGKTFLQVVGNWGNVIDIEGGAGAHKSNITLEGFTIIGNQSSNTASLAGIRLDYIDYLRIYDVEVRNIGNPTTDTQGIGIGINFCSHVFTDGTLVKDYTHYGMSFTDDSDVQNGMVKSVHSSTFPVPANAGNHGFFVTGSSNMTTGEVMIDNPNATNGFVGYEVVGNSQNVNTGIVHINAPNALNAYGLHFTSTVSGQHNSVGQAEVNGMSYGAMFDSGVKDIRIGSLVSTNATSSAIGSGSGGADGISIGYLGSFGSGSYGAYWNTGKLTIDQVDIEYSGKDGFYADEFGSYITINGGVIKNSGQLAANTYSGFSDNASAALSGGLKYNIINGVHFIDDQTIHTQKYGIYSIGKRNTYGSSNVFLNNTTAPIYTPNGVYDNNQVVVPVTDIFTNVLAFGAPIRTSESLAAATPINFTITNQLTVPEGIFYSFSHSNITAFSATINGTDAGGKPFLLTLTQADGYSGYIYPPLSHITSIVMNSRTGTGVGDTANITTGVYFGLTRNPVNDNAIYAVTHNGVPTTFGTLNAIFSSTGNSRWQPDGGVSTGDNYTISYNALNNIR